LRNRFARPDERIMVTYWPWLVVAGLGALHGLNPATGWMFAAASGVRASDEAQVRRALLPIAIGHATSIAVVACVVTQGVMLDRTLFRFLAGALLVCVASYRLLRRTAQPPPIGRHAGNTAIALWSFLMATAHGAGLMLIPALVPLCRADSPAREITASGSLFLALAAVGVHTVAMLVTTGAVATGVYRGVAMHTRLSSRAAARHAWTAVLAVTGGVLIVVN
jgi:hypothetical protein